MADVNCIRCGLKIDATWETRNNECPQHVICIPDADLFKIPGITHMKSSNYPDVPGFCYRAILPKNKSTERKTKPRNPFAELDSLFSSYTKEFFANLSPINPYTIKSDIDRDKQHEEAYNTLMLSFTRNKDAPL